MLETLVIIGNGMVGHKFVELMLERGADSHYRMVIFGEERRTAYDRVHLSEYFSDKSVDDLLLATPEGYRQSGVQIFTGDRVASIDRQAKKITSSKGVVVRYDKLVLATGSYPFVPPIPGNDAAGTFVYRTLDDLDAIRTYAANAKTGVVVGGGLLGLECANALKLLGLETHVVEFAPRLMPVQLDELGGSMLRKKIAYSRFTAWVWDRAALGPLKINQSLICICCWGKLASRALARSRSQASPMQWEGMNSAVWHSFFLAIA